LHFHVFSTNNTINTYKFKSSVEVYPVEVYPVEVNPLEVYPLEAYLIGKGVVEVSGCHKLFIFLKLFFDISLAEYLNVKTWSLTS
jgi:hypothetical protein